MARILFTSTQGTSEWAGSEVLWYHAALRLRQQGHYVAVVLPRVMRTEPTIRRMRDAEIEVVGHPADFARFWIDRVSRRRSPQRPASGAPIVRWAKRWEADMVVLSQASCWGAYREMLALSALSIPYICLSQLNSPSHWPGDRLHEAVGDAFFHARAAVFVSRGNLELLCNQIARRLDNAHVIYNPPSFATDIVCGPPVAGQFHLLNVGRISPGQKGQDVLLDVLALPEWRARPVKLEIAGEGDRRWLERLIAVKELSNVTLLGQLRGLSPAWERATFGVFPSRYEGMPLAVVEGMALGRAVIATDVAGHAEWIRHGETGFLADAPSVRSLHRALTAAWNSRERARELGANALAVSQEMLTPHPAEKLTSLINAKL